MVLKRAAQLLRWLPSYATGSVGKKMTLWPELPVCRSMATAPSASHLLLCHLPITTGLGNKRELEDVMSCA